MSVHTCVHTESVRQSPFLNLRDAVLLNAVVVILCLVFKAAMRLDARFRKAADSFSAVYQFSSGRAARRLIFTGRGVATRRGRCGVPDFEIRFIDLTGALSYMAKYPNDPITLIMENRIEQVGNLFYLYKFGYLCGLCESFFSRRKQEAAETKP